MNTRNLNKILVVLFFAVLLCAGMLTFKDYGTTGDEALLRHLGMLTHKYVLEGGRELFEYRDRFYGPAFEMFLVSLEKALPLGDLRSVFFLRHLVLFLLFCLGVFFFYLLCKHHFKSWKISLLGCLFLVLSPRIYAHAFFNAKDMVAFSFFIIGMYALVKYLEEKTLGRAVPLALITGVLIDVRLTGLLLPIVAAVLFVGDLIFSRDRRKSEAIGSFVVYCALSAVFVVLFWPMLWESPLAAFVTALKQMSRFPWNEPVLYFGRYLPASALPWHYSPVWILITTPILYIVCFFIGLASILKQRYKVMPLLFFFLPLAAVILLDSVMYDGWRHMFFIYPAFIMIAMEGVAQGVGPCEANTSHRLRPLVSKLFILTVALSLTTTAYFMVRYHPYQNVYFNALAGGMPNAAENFEMDYWGLSYREGMEYIAEKDSSDKIYLHVTSLPGNSGAIPSLMVDPKDRKRFIFVETPQEADYVLDNFRWRKGAAPYGKEIFSIKISGAKILGVYKR